MSNRKDPRARSAPPRKSASAENHAAPRQRIEAENGWSAVIWETADGVAVEIFQRRVGGNMRLSHTDLIVAPFHLVRDQIAAMLNELPHAAWADHPAVR